MRIPEFMAEIVATFSHLARQSPHINQRSGVSVRLTVTNHETLVANAVRRALRLGEDDVVPRISDLDALASSTGGKVEIESLEEGRDGEIIEQLLKAAILTVFKERFGTERVREVLAAFESGTVVHAGDDVASADYVELFGDVPGLRRRRRAHRRRREPGRARPAPSSSCSRACTSRSASTRTPSAPGPPTEAADASPRQPSARLVRGWGVLDGVDEVETPALEVSSAPPTPTSSGWRPSSRVTARSPRTSSRTPSPGCTAVPSP